MAAKKKSGKATSKLSEAFEKVTKPKHDSEEVTKQKAHIKFLSKEFDRFVAKNSGAQHQAKVRLDDARKHLATLS